MAADDTPGSPRPAMPPDLLVLFDIDGTLLHTMGAGIRGMNRAFARLYTRPDALDDVPVAGRTDRAIVTDGFRRIGVAPEDGRIRELRDVYIGELPDELDRLAGTSAGVLPGVSVTIAALDREPAVALGLITGNFETIAAMKLDRYGLARHFTFGGFGDHHLDRRDLVPMALSRAAAAGIDTRRSRIVIVGDTPLDVDCAHAHGAIAVAVATGNYSADELDAVGADAVFDGLGTEAVAAILGAR